jgi:hypothetical protein
MNQINLSVAAIAEESEMKLVICDYCYAEKRILPAKYRKHVRDPDKPSRRARWINTCEDHRKMLSTQKSSAILASLMDEEIQADGILTQFSKGANDLPEWDISQGWPQNE